VVLENKVCYHNYTTPANERGPAAYVAVLSSTSCSCCRPESRARHDTRHGEGRRAGEGRAAGRAAALIGTRAAQPSHASVHGVRCFAGFT
jgi:hypothetical protein